MVAAANLVEVAALVGDTARATMLGALMSGQSLTGGELAFLAHVSRSTASEHLTKLVDARLIAVTRRRRFSYYRIASPLVAQMLESMKVVAAIEMPPRYQPRSMRDDAMRFARTCYDHLAGTAAVAIADALVVRDYIVLGDDGGEVTPAGARFLPISAPSYLHPTLTRVRGRVGWGQAAGFSAGRVSIGASGAITSPVTSAPKSAGAVCNAAGLSASATAVRCD